MSCIFILLKQEVLFIVILKRVNVNKDALMLHCYINIHNICLSSKDRFHVFVNFLYQHFDFSFRLSLLLA